jgi:tetratricopeptide (TPR) repeat protein
MDDVFAVQDEIAKAIVDKLKVKLRGEPDRPLVKPHTDDLEAYNLYLQGRYYWSRRYAGFLQRALECFEQAIARDPLYAMAHAGLADAYSVLGIYDVLPPRVAFGKAKRAAQQAISLDGGLAEAHSAMAMVQLFFDWDFTAAEREARRAIELNPNGGRNHVLLALPLSHLGRFDEAFTESTRGRSLEPVSELVGFYVAFVLFFGRQFEEALAECRRVLELDPGFTPGLWIETLVLSCMERHDQAIETAERMVMQSHRMSFFLAYAAWAYATAGRRDETQALVDELHERSRQQYVSPLYFAYVAMALGEIDQAFEWLERAYEDRTSFLVWMGVSPVYDPIRGDPRFVVMLKKLGLEGVSPPR